MSVSGGGVDVSTIGAVGDTTVGIGILVLAETALDVLLKAGVSYIIA